MSHERKIVFVDPPTTMEERYGRLAGAGNQLPSTGLLSLAAVTRESGFKTALLDASSPCLGFAETAGQVLALRPDYVGITAISVSVYNAARLAELIKAGSRNVTTIIGGPHITALPDETMRRFPAFDIGVIGEGEETIIELLRGLDKGADLKAIKGLALRDNGGIRITGDPSFVGDLDTLPFPAWDMLDNFPGRYQPSSFQFRRLPAMSLITSRGCPNKCIFCSRVTAGSNCRAFSAEYVMEMIGILHHRYGIKELVIEDDNSVLFKDRLIRICEMMLREGLDISWSCMALINKVEPALLKLMKRSGCWQIGYGIESGDEGVIDFTKKGITLGQVSQALEWTKSAGIESRGFFILGFPVDNDRTIRATIDFAKRSPLNDIDVCMMTPFPGTEMYDIARKTGIFQDDWKRMTMEHAVFIPEGMTKERMEKYFNQILREFYLRPGIIMKYIIKIIRYPRGAVRIIQGLAAFLRKIFLDEPAGAGGSHG